MKNQVVQRNSEKQSSKATARPAVDGGNGISVLPPSYGIEFVDQPPAHVADAAARIFRPGAASLVDNRPEAIAQRQLAESILNGPRMAAQSQLADALRNSPRIVAQRTRLAVAFGEFSQLKDATVNKDLLQDEELQMKANSEMAQLQAESLAPRNDTGLPDDLKSGIEALSGVSLNGVNVHYNSSQPAQLNALAYTQGTDIHAAPGRNTICRMRPGTSCSRRRAVSRPRCR